MTPTMLTVREARRRREDEMVYRAEVSRAEDEGMPVRFEDPTASEVIRAGLAALSHDVLVRWHGALDGGEGIGSAEVPAFLIAATIHEDRFELRDLILDELEARDPQALEAAIARGIVQLCEEDARMRLRREYGTDGRLSGYVAAQIAENTLRAAQVCTVFDAMVGVL